MRCMCFRRIMTMRVPGVNAKSRGKVRQIRNSRLRPGETYAVPSVSSSQSNIRWW
jgi:hypothetical protein